MGPAEEMLFGVVVAGTALLGAGIAGSRAMELARRQHLLRVGQRATATVLGVEARRHARRTHTFWLSVHFDLPDRGGVVEGQCRVSERLARFSPVGSQLRIRYHAHSPGQFAPESDPTLPGYIWTELILGLIAFVVSAAAYTVRHR
jgi:hypothetical protein